MVSSYYLDGFFLHTLILKTVCVCIYCVCMCDWWGKRFTVCPKNNTHLIHKRTHTQHREITTHREQEGEQSDEHSQWGFGGGEQQYLGGARNSTNHIGRRLDRFGRGLWTNFSRARFNLLLLEMVRRLIQVLYRNVDNRTHLNWMMPNICVQQSLYYIVYPKVCLHVKCVYVKCKHELFVLNINDSQQKCGRLHGIANTTHIPPKHK